MKELNNVQNIIFRAGGIALAAGLLLRLFSPLWGLILYAAGAWTFASMQMLARYEGNDLVLRRLRSQQLLSDVAFLCSATCLFAQTYHWGYSWMHHNLWLILLIVACVLQVYTAFRIPQEMGKQPKHPTTHLPLLLLTPLLFSQCASHMQYSVEGTTNVSLLEGKRLVLKTFCSDSLRSIDSCWVQHGKINFSGSLDSVQMVNIFVNGESIMPMVLEEGGINLTIDEVKQNVTGTPLNDSLYNFIRKKVRLDKELDNLPYMDSQLIMDGVDEYERRRIIASKAQALEGERDRLITSFIVRHSDNVLGPGVFMILTCGFPFPKTTPQIDEIMFKAKPYFKNHPYVKHYMKAAKCNMEQIHTGM